MWELWTIGLFVYTLLVVRLCFIVPCFSLVKKPTGSTTRWERKSLMVLLGSGGHTGEMLRMLTSVDSLDRLRKITFVVSSGDTSSIVLLEKFAKKKRLTKDTYTILELPRARSVGEGLLSSVKSTIISTFSTFATLSRQGHRIGHPDILMVNGPGTSVPLCLFFTCWNFLGESNTRILYIESLARVKRLSLSGTLCRPLAHRFIVQWAELAGKTNAEYHGILV
ncbi:CYFA0S11e02190g1_1 [Cyberlindnera fabianii]|uniref:UDP-N-acetylglucosamine transferase subunit ALG14 n=1 Tax=Cyberlindnera fabianii TaxID=36022 RepID=A0A061B6C5_CYBFA|nr:CYFA0S11e02190g1_1 [Cyberlindnera fabianii]